MWIDTVCLVIGLHEAGSADLLSDVSPYINFDRVTRYPANDIVIATAKLDNLAVSVSPYGLKILGGSLCKWMLGDNYRAMTRVDVQRAIERLSDILHLPMGRARVTRLDVGLSIPVAQPYADYANHLGALRNAKRLANDGSLYYCRHGGAEVLCFYDKNREQRSHGGQIPDPYRGCNVLRYEQRYMRRVSRLLGVEPVAGATLYNEVFGRLLAERWAKAYNSISKINDMTWEHQIRGVRDFNLIGRLAYIDRLGGQSAALDDINERLNRGELSRKAASDLRKVIIEACTAAVTVPNAAIAELDKKIIDAAKGQHSYSTAITQL